MQLKTLREMEDVRAEIERLKAEQAELMRQELAATMKREEELALSAFGVFRRFFKQQAFFTASGQNWAARYGQSEVHLGRDWWYPHRDLHIWISGAAQLNYYICITPTHESLAQDVGSSSMTGPPALDTLKKERDQLLADVRAISSRLSGTMPVRYVFSLYESDDPILKLLPHRFNSFHELLATLFT